MLAPNVEQIVNAVDLANTLIPRDKHARTNALDVLRNGENAANCFARTALVAARLAVVSSVDAVYFGISVNHGLISRLTNDQTLGHAQLFVPLGDSTGFAVVDPRKIVGVRTVSSEIIVYQGQKRISDPLPKRPAGLALYDLLPVEEAVDDYQLTPGASEKGGFTFEELVEYVADMDDGGAETGEPVSSPM